MSDLTAHMPALSTRAEGRCELCGQTDGLSPLAVPPRTGADAAVLVCATCAQRLSGDQALDAKHWFCLQEAGWSEVPAVQVLAWRTLKRMTAESWVQDLLDQLYLDEDTLSWAEQGGDDAGESAVTPTVDSNGTRLSDGDSVTLIKDLDVKGAGFTAKRGTMVKNIRLTEDPGLIEGRVNKTGIYLKTEFLKRA